MTKKSVVQSVEPVLAIPGGELKVMFEAEGCSPLDINCFFDGLPAEISAASNTSLLVRVPEGLQKENVGLTISIDEIESDPFEITVGKLLCDNMHIVSNPAVDPSDGSIILTRSGTRGQELPATLFRFRDGNAEEMPADVMNPTSVAFDSGGRLFVSNRADGEVLQINNDSEVVPLASELGVATGLAFDSSGNLFVGDRGGTIYRVSSMGDARDWTRIEASVSAFHMAFGPSGNLFVTAPGLCSHDVVHRIETDGTVGVYFKGLGRPQGLAFDDDGNLYVAACLKSRHGIVKIFAGGEGAVLYLAGMSIVGLCFDSKGRLLVATGDALYQLNTKTYGTLV